MDYIHDLRPYIGHKKIILCCAAVVIIKDGKILLQHRKDNNEWGIVGGLLELDETFYEAAKRETKEETGLDIVFDSFLGIYHHYNMEWANHDKAHTVCACYLGHIASGEPRIDEESLELKFFDLDDMPHLFAEDHRQAVEAYKKGISYPIPIENPKK